MIKHHLSFIAIAILGALLFVGCGGRSSSQNHSSTKTVQLKKKDLEPGTTLDDSDRLKLDNYLAGINPEYDRILRGEFNLVNDFDLGMLTSDFGLLHQLDSAISLYYKNKYVFSCGYALVENDGKYSFINRYNTICGTFDEAEPFFNGIAKVKIGERTDYLLMGNLKLLGDCLEGDWICSLIGERVYHDENQLSVYYNTPIHIDKATNSFNTVFKRNMQTMAPILWKGEDAYYHVQPEEGWITLKVASNYEARFGNYTDYYCDYNGRLFDAGTDLSDYRRSSMVASFFLCALSDGPLVFSPEGEENGQAFLIFYPLYDDPSKGRVLVYNYYQNQYQVRWIFEYSIDDGAINIPKRLIDAHHRSILTNNSVTIKTAEEDNYYTFEDSLSVHCIKDYKLFYNRTPRFRDYIDRIEQLIDVSDASIKTLDDLLAHIKNRHGNYQPRYPVPSSSSSSSVNSQLNQEYQRLMSQLNKTADPVERQSIQAQMSVIKSQMEASQRDFINRLTQ